MTVGRFRLLEKIGEGGMGDVFLADQLSPVRRRVALKLIKLGMDTREVVARFESERQALALLNHPNIAHVFDAGSTPDGRPYFAMEFVQGLSIRDYCARERLTVPERLRLFIQVCEGVQHAHQKGIIHRDLKPSNILVALQDGKPVPKIIDFGIAKATSQRLTESTLHTEVGRLVGTPAYMSPEQADYTLLDIDTRTDVYSLGAVLYELLTGEQPLEQGGARAQGYEEVIRAIREVEPVRPSTRVTTGAAGATAGGAASSAEGVAETAKAFRADPSSLARELRGDLDWIVLKALEKDRARRYDSASGLAADIERHLNHEPVLASPPSTPYRIRKFVRRHRVGVAAGVAVGLALIAGIVGTTLGLLRAQEAERKALVEAETATEVTDFMVDLFHVSDPSEARGNSITAREVLDRGAKRIQQQLTDKPVVRVRLMEAIGSVYANIGLFTTAEPILREVLAARENLTGPNSPEVAAGLHGLSGVLGNMERGEDAIALNRRALAIRQKTLGPEHIDTAYSEWELGVSLLWMLHETSESRLHLERALEIFRAMPGKGDKGASWCLNDLGVLLMEQRRYEEALKNFREALAIKEKILAPDDGDVGNGLNSVGFALVHLGRYAEAKPLLERALTISHKLIGPEHALNSGQLQSLGECLRLMGENTAARDTLERAVKLSEKWTGSGHLVQTHLAHQSLGSLYTDMGQYARAESNFKQAVAGFERSGNKPSLATTLERYAILRDRQGRPQEAARLRARAKELRGTQS